MRPRAKEKQFRINLFTLFVAKTEQAWDEEKFNNESNDKCQWDEMEQ